MLNKYHAISILLLFAATTYSADTYKTNIYTKQKDNIGDPAAIYTALSSARASIPTTCTGSNPIKDGAEGAPGPRGVAGQIISISATGLPPGSSPTAINNGSFSQADIVLGIPAGATGATGATGLTGAAGIGANALFCNISGATRTITYAADGTTPYPSALSTYVVQLWNGATRLIADTWNWWTGGSSQRVFGSATTETFQPSLKPVFSHYSNNNFVGVQARYSSSVGIRYCVTGIPIPATKIGTTGATGAAGGGSGGTPPGGALNSVQYMYSSASTKKIFRGFGRYSVHSGGGTLIL